MKELKLLTEWADGISEASTFTQPKRLGTPMTSKADRPLPRNIDIQYKAQRAHPELSPEQALAMYMSDELVDKEKMDFSQNKLINRVKGENEKLTRTVNDLGKELHDFEQQSQQTDQEVERLKSLSAKLKPAGEVTKQVAQATSQQIEKMMKEVDDLRTKPGMTPEKQKELEQKINDIKTGGLSSEEVKNIHSTIDVLSAKQEIDDIMFDKVMTSLEATQAKLDKKEERFQKSNIRNQDMQKSWGAKFKELNDKIASIDARADQKLAQIDKATEEADATLDRIAQMVRQVNPAATKPVAQALSSLDDRDEVTQAMTTPTATTIPATADDNQDLEEPDMFGPEDDEDYASVADLLNKYRKPSNVKGGRVNEEIQMHEPEDEVETIIIPKLVRRYNYMYPNDLKTWSEGQLKEILRRTVDRRLLIWAPDINEQRVKDYLTACHSWLRKLRPVQAELPGMGDAPPRSVQESLFKQFENGLDKLTGGY